MGKHCSFRTGGVAQDFFIPETLNGLSQFLKKNQKSILMLGLGSNLLVRERGFDGVVIKLKTLINWKLTIASLSQVQAQHWQNFLDFVILRA